MDEYTPPFEPIPGPPLDDGWQPQEGSWSVCPMCWDEAYHLAPGHDVCSECAQQLLRDL